MQTSGPATDNGARHDGTDPGESPGQKLGLWMCVALVIGNMIGAGVFLLPASLAPLGWSAIIGWGLSITGTLCLALMLARLARLLPGGSGSFTYAAEAFGPGVSFIVAWSYWVSCWTVNAALAVAATSNLSILFPGITASALLPALLSVAAVWLFTGVNLFGVREAGRMQVATTALKLVPLVAAALVAAWILGADRAPAAPMAGTAPVTAANISGAATLTLFALLGFESALIVGDRVRDPERTVPRATMLGAVATGILYLLSCTAVTLMLPADTVHASNAPFSTFFTIWVGPLAGDAVALFAAIAALGALNGFVLLAGEMPRDMAAGGMLPPGLARVNRHGAPARSLILASMLTTLVVYANYTRGMAGLFNFMVLVTTSTAIIFYLFAALAALKFARSGRFPMTPVHLGLTIAGFIYAGWAFYGAGLEASLWGLAMTAAGIPLYLAARRSAPARGEPTAIT